MYKPIVGSGEVNKLSFLLNTDWLEFDGAYGNFAESVFFKNLAFNKRVGDVREEEEEKIQKLKSETVAREG